MPLLRFFKDAITSHFKGFKCVFYMKPKLENLKSKLFVTQILSSQMSIVCYLLKKTQLALLMSSDLRYG